MPLLGLSRTRLITATVTGGGRLMARVDFESDLEFGVKWERKITELLKDKIQTVMVENISFDDDPETQLNGIDMVTELGDATIDVKTEKPGYMDSPNLPFETWSVKDEKLGWFYTSDADFVLWTRLNHRGGVHSLRAMVLDDELRDWFGERIESFRSHEVDNTTWTTVIRLVPMRKIPENKLYELATPDVTSENDEQTGLDAWVMSGE